MLLIDSRHLHLSQGHLEIDAEGGVRFPIVYCLEFSRHTLLALERSFSDAVLQLAEHFLQDRFGFSRETVLL